MTDTITTELRESMVDDARGLLYIGETVFADLCDAIDVVHASLERENESLRRELDRVLGEQEGRDGWVRKDKEHIISHATIEVTPHIDWSRMADELDEFVEIVRGMAGGVK